MKKIVLLLCLLLSAAGFAQNFPGKDVALLKGKELKVLPLNKSTAGLGYKGFYSDASIKSIYKKGRRFTDVAALEGKVFTVVAYEPHYSDYVLTLDNPETGRIYYDYHVYAKQDFVFEVLGGLSFPDGYFCKNLVITKKWVAASKTYVDETHMPFTDGMCLYRTPDDIFKLRLSVTVENLKKKELKGAKLILENGETISFPDAVIDMVQEGGKYTLITKPRLRFDAASLQKLKQYKIVRKEIGSYSDEVSEGELIREYITCLAK